MVEHYGVVANACDEPIQAQQGVGAEDNNEKNAKAKTASLSLVLASAEFDNRYNEDAKHEQEEPEPKDGRVTATSQDEPAAIGGIRLGLVPRVRICRPKPGDKKGDEEEPHN
jgi:hypothetical protein